MDMNDNTKSTNKTSEMAGADAANKANTTQKTEQLDTVRDDATNEALTTNQGVKIADNQNSLRAGIRGSTLLEDFILREKITHFDHERIPERIVHARGVGAHGYFQAYEGNERLTKAGFLTDPTIQTPIFVRFSTVQGPRGSADTVRDIRGFAIKFYTQEGNFDLVGNNAPVFFVQDGIKFPDFVHAVKPEPDTEIPIQWALGDLSSGIGLLSFSNVGASLSSIAAGYLSGGSAGAASAIANGANKGNGATLGLGNFDNSRKAYGALIQALKTNTKSNLLSTPSIVTMDNEEAYIVVGQNVPFVTGSVTTNSTGINPYTTVERKDVGVTLKVVPHIGEGGTVRLEVEQEVSAVQDSRGQAADLVTSKRAIKTAVLAEHGQTVVLGGLVSDDTSLSRQGIPGLSSIPYVGRLFRSDNRSNVKRNLLVFIHPTIVGDANDVRRLSQQRYNQLYSLQLAMDKNGNFAKLPEQVDDIYNQKMTPPSIASKPKNYQQVPSGGKSSTITTPVAVEPTVQKQTLQLPDPEINRTKNTVTTTTLRPSTAP